MTWKENASPVEMRFLSLAGGSFRLERMTASFSGGFGLEVLVLRVIPVFAGKFGIEFLAGMRVDFHHDFFRGTLVTFPVVLTVGNTAINLRHSFHPLRAILHNP